MSNRSERMHAVLTARFAPSALEIADESGRHANHAGRHGIEAGETHYRITMVADAFTGQGRVARSRLVHEVLDAEIKAGLHALALTLRAPGEA